MAIHIHPEILSPDLRGMSAEQISLPWIMMEEKGCLCFSTNVVEYSPKLCIIDDCLDNLQYIRIPCGTNWVSAVVVVAVAVVVVVVVEVILVEVIVVIEVVVAVVDPAIYHRPAVACNVSQEWQSRAGLIQLGPRPIHREGGD